MEWNGWVVLFLIIIFFLLIMPVMLMTLMMSFLIYKVIKNDLNLKKEEDKIDDSSPKKGEDKINDSSLKKKEVKIDNLNLTKEEKSDDIIKKKEEESPNCPTKAPVINIYINLSENDNGGRCITSAEDTQIEEGKDKDGLKNAVYIHDSLKSKKDSEKKERNETTVVTKKNDMKQLPDSLQNHESDKKNAKNVSQEKNLDELKNKTKQASNSLQSHESNTQYVSMKNCSDELNLDEINREIAEKGYGIWVKEEWERIGTGDEKRKLGDEVILQHGVGNIRIIKSQNGIYYIGVPAKAQWKGCDFDIGAFKECYDVINPVEDNMDYEVVRIDKLARLWMKDDKFQILAKGKVQVNQLS